MKEVWAAPKITRVRSLPLLLKLEGGAGSQTPAAWEPAPPKWRKTCRAETVPWRFQLRKVLHCFGGFWRWMSVDCSGQVWAALVGSGELPMVLKRSWTVLKHFLDGFGRFWTFLENSGLSWNTVTGLESFPWLWKSPARTLEPGTL